jgi:glucosamine-6-phosphate deaminase
VIVFLLFEYYPLTGKLQGSFGQLKNMLLDHVDIPAENIFYPDGTMDKHQIMQACAAYEQKIASFGGIDLQLLGIGRSGNIGFNEPGSLTNSQTRLILLDTLSREDAAEFFSNVEMVPVSAFTLGISTILKAKRIVLVAWGEHKSTVVKNAVEGPMSETIPASYLQLHSNVKMVIDLHAASELTRISMPWLVTSCEWDSKLIRRAIVWLCMKLKKPILKLTNKDYNDNGLSELLAIYGSAYNVKIRIFNDLQHTITGWPGANPMPMIPSPRKSTSVSQTYSHFQSTSDDDVISMGGTFKRLIDQKHNVHVAYQTSGNIAVADHEVIRFLSFVKGFKDLFDSNNELIQSKYEEIEIFLLYEKRKMMWIRLKFLK